MYECGNGRGTFHSVRKPHVQWELGAFAHAATEDADAGDEEEPVSPLMFGVGSQLADFRLDGSSVAAVADDFSDFVASLECDHSVSWREIVGVFRFVQLAEDAELLDVAIGVFHVAERKRAKARPQGHEAN